ncbi:hypothetical protein Pint_33053 [Pistacia integerrima]|uniref:Uncharacterized protein n=1 Tax=Pistacia integerrima TaxID=434235 RepID=A0ACC0X5H4_9ROSI|nr:hypothetical protein Pint_33053 [Pistacia integerrima]
MILIFYITHKVISLHGENQIGSRNDITPDWSHGWNNFDRMLMQGGLVASKELVLSLMFTYSKPLLLSNLRTTKMNDDVLAIAVSVDAKFGGWILMTVINPFKLMLIGHHTDVWCLAISNSGDYIVTGSHDRSIRHRDRTEEPISLSSRHSEEELDRIAQHEEEKTRGNVLEFQPDIRMLGLSPSHYVLRTLSNVKTNDLEQTLLALPFADALKLLSYLKDWASNPDKVILFALWNI